MKIIRLSLLIHLVFVALSLPSVAQPNSTGIQYHWITQNKVYLWKSADDASPIVATLNSNNEWELASDDVLKQWRPIMSKVMQSYYPSVNSSSFTDQQLWSLMLTKLRNDYTSVKWAKPRMPSVEVYLRAKDNQTVEIAFLWKENNETKREVYTFKLQNGVWKKDQEINLKRILNVSETSDDVHVIFDIPKDRPIPNGKDWILAWDSWIRNFIDSDEKIRPVMYRDQNSSLQWLWREHLSADAEIPVTPRQMPPKPAPIPEPSQATIIIDRPAKSSIEVWEILLIVTILVIAFFIFWFNRKSIGKQVRPLFVSHEGLESLHRLVKERYQKVPHVTNESTNSLLLYVLDWVHQEYLALLNSTEFQQESDKFKAVVLEEYQQVLGINQADGLRIQKWVSLGRGSEEAVLHIKEVQGQLFVKTAIKKKLQKEFLSDEEWIKHWPDIVGELDSLLTQSQQDCAKIKEQQEERDYKQKEELSKKEEEIKKTVEVELSNLKGNLTAITNEFNTTSSNLEVAEQNIINLNNQLAEITEKKELAQKARSSFEKKADEIQKVQNLSQHLRRLIQGYCFQQQEKDGELRSVGLVATLINFSLYQMCFSIMEEQASLKRAMAQNLFRSTQLFSPSDGYTAVRASLEEMVPGVESALEDLRDVGDYTIDHRLFQAFLSRLKTDTGLNLGPFFIAPDEGEKITLASTS